MDGDGFVQWFLAQAAQLRQMDPDAATQAIQAELLKVEETLACEVSDEGEADARELVISAQGDSRLFEQVEALAPKLKAAEGWTVHALKPPRGFEFKLDADGTVVDARSLYFEPLESPSMPGILGLRLFAPEATVPALGQLGWWVLETGIGEKALALIEHLEVAAMPEDQGELMPIKALGTFVQWHSSRRRGTVHS